ncbi:transmembrane signal receptor [Lithospermum erythrorhizon]|uniref:Transmembrane signal receptor n=1 Tax=Lithospermum erythrorhizon TaxID=34254 RepID=A0AAV3P3Q2_LITER
MRLNFLQTNQKKFRREQYQEVVDSVVSGILIGGKVGKRVYLPSTFIGEPRDLRHRYLNSMALAVKTPSCVKHDWHDSSSHLLLDPTLYRQLVGALQYLFFTRPDITFAVNLASQFMHQPKEVHLQGVKRILRYLLGTITLGLMLHKVSSFLLTVYSDFDWAGCHSTRRSTTGFCIYLGSNIISWTSKKQQTVATSSTEAEYRALASATAETTWVQQLFGELRIPLPTAPVAYCDNCTSITILFFILDQSISILIIT